jgi:uncharacterized protein YndB with AHSA1/START domain
MNGTLRTENGRSVLRFERRLAHPVAKVWRALTERSEQKHWFPAELDADWRVGGEIRWVGEDGEVWTTGTITAWDPPRLFEHVADDEVLRFELNPDEDGGSAGCRLVFTHTFDDRAGAASFGSGWHGCLDMLELVLAGTPDPNAPNPWKERHEAYVEEFGLLEGTVERTDEGHVVRFERVFTEPVDAAWQLLVSSEDESGTTPAVGGQPPIGFTHDDYDVAGPITAYDEAMPARTTWGETGKLLEYVWSLDGTERGRVRWEIIAGPGGMARVIVTQTVPEELAAHRSTALAAWHTHFELLASHLKGAPLTGPGTGRDCEEFWDSRVNELRKHYADA